MTEPIEVTDMGVIAFLSDLFNEKPIETIVVNIASVGADTIISLTCKDVNND